MTRPRLLVLVGLPASGKSSWARMQGGGIISTDALRHLLADDETDQTIHSAVFATLRYLLRRRLQLGRPLTIVDATNTAVWERRPYVKIAEQYDARAEAIFFNVPLEVCKQRNRERSRVVPEWAMDAMGARLVPPTRAEGFETITELT